jgi:hypothetical protein
MVLYFLRQIQREKLPPKKIIDDTLRVNYS